MNRRPFQHRGYTLIEILAVVLVLGIISAITLPQLGSRDDMKTSSAARELVAHVLEAQSRAVATGSPRYVAFDRDGASYAVMDSMDPVTRTSEPSDTSKCANRGGVMQGVTTVGSFDGTSTLVFDALGAPGSYSKSTGKISPLRHGQIVVNSGAESMTIAIQPTTGAISVRRTSSTR